MGCCSRDQMACGLSRVPQTPAELEGKPPALLSGSSLSIELELPGVGKGGGGGGGGWGHMPPITDGGEQSSSIELEPKVWGHLPSCHCQGGGV